MAKSKTDSFEDMFKNEELMRQYFKTADNLFTMEPHFADGGQADLGLVPEYVTPEQAQLMAPKAIDPALAMKQQFYNEAMMPGVPSGGPDYEQAVQMQNVGQLFAPGQPPKEVVPEVWARAEKRYETMQNVQKYRQEQQAADLEKRNAARVAAGLEPLPNPALSMPAQPIPQQPMQQMPQQVIPQAQPRQQGMPGMQSYLSAYDRMAQEEAKLAEAQAKIAADRHQQLLDLNNQWQKNIQETKADYDAAVEDYKNAQIKPNQFMENMSSGQKVRTAIGLLLGGIGAGMLHSTDNPAMKFLQNQIDRDVEAQRMNLAKKGNVLSALKEKYGNMKDAMDMAKVFNANMYANEMEQAALKSGGPMAIAKAQMLKAQFLQPYMMMGMKIEAGRTAEQALDRGGAQGREAMSWLQQVDPEKYKDIQSRHVPGIGVAEVPVPEKVREKLTNQTELMSMLSHAQAFVRQHGSNLSLLNPAVRNQAAIIGQTIQSKLRETQLGTVFKESELPLLNKMIDEQPLTVFHAFTVDPKLQELKRGLGDSIANQMKMYGFKKAQMMEQQIPQYAPMIPQVKGKK